jgi:DNA-binding transcriptional ArsR family regulator
MARSAQTQLPLFRSSAQAELLTHLFVTEADRPLSLSALSNRTDIPVSTVQREVERLEQAGLVRSERVGQTRLVAANRDSPYFDDLASLLLKAFGPRVLLTSLFRRIPRIDHAYVYGSWASRYHDQPGPAPRDVDVVVVGDPNVNAVYAAARRAESALGMEVNPIVIGSDEWETPKGLVKRIKEGPLVKLELNGAA